MCQKAGIGIGTPCITATAVFACGLLFCCCCAAKAKSRRSNAPAMYVQQGYIQQPQQPQGFRGYGAE